MRKALSRNPDVIMALIAGYFMLAVAFRIIRSPALEVDESQQAVVAQFLLLGYGSQPPLYSWLQYGLNELIGTSIASLSLLKNGLLFLCCLYFWLAAKLVLRDKALANIATLGVLTLPPVFIMAQRDLSHTVLALFAVSLFLYALFRALKEPDMVNYLLVGAAIGIGSVAKYNFALVPVAAIVAVALHRQWRHRLLDWRLLLTLAVAMIIPLAHGLWLVDHLDIATRQTAHEMHEGSERITFDALAGTFDLLTSLLQGVALTTAIFAALFFGHIKAIWRATDQWTRLVGRMLLISLLLVLAIVWGFDVTHVREKWLTLYLLLWPLYLSLKVQAAGIPGEKKLPAMLGTVSILTIGFLFVLIVRGLIAPYFEVYSLVNIPYDAFARAVRQEGHPEPDYVITAGALAGGNLKMQFPNATVFSGDPNTETLPSPWPDGSVVLLAATSADGKMPDDAAATLAAIASHSHLPGPAAMQHLDVPFAGRGEKQQAFFYAWETAGQQ